MNAHGKPRFLLTVALLPARSTDDGIRPAGRWKLAAPTSRPALVEAVLPERVHAGAFKLQPRGPEEAAGIPIEPRIVIEEGVSAGTPAGKASRNCWTSHSAVGWKVLQKTGNLIRSGINAIGLPFAAEPGLRAGLAILRIRGCSAFLQRCSLFASPAQWTPATPSKPSRQPAGAGAAQHHCGLPAGELESRLQQRLVAAHIVQPLHLTGPRFHPPGPDSFPASHSQMP